MTIDEAIQHCKEVIENNKISIENQNPLFPNTIEECKECIDAHKQLMNWLEELKYLRKRIV